MTGRPRTPQAPAGAPGRARPGRAGAGRLLSGIDWGRRASAARGHAADQARVPPAATDARDVVETGLRAAGAELRKRGVSRGPRPQSRTAEFVPSGVRGRCALGPLANRR
ncbi:hypothetical protein QJS66_18960 [Kocuria rhizophila]|nr:hypothetical protein QJS66_18960 [Kocuria rhizophila]